MEFKQLERVYLILGFLLPFAGVQIPLWSGVVENEQTANICYFYADSW